MATTLQPRFPTVAALLAEAKEDLTAFRQFPAATGASCGAPTPLERLNKERKRPTNLVGTFPMPPRSPAWPRPC